MRRICPTCAASFNVPPSVARRGHGRFCSAACVRRGSPSPPGGPGDLGPRRRAVVERVARGMSRPAVAAELGISVRTVAAHLATTYRQLGLANRVELANWFHGHG